MKKMLKVKKVRIHKGLRQNFVADKIGTTPSYLGMVELGKRPLAINLAKRLAYIYNVRWMDLFEDESC